MHDRTSPSRDRTDDDHGVTDAIAEHREFLEELAEQDHLRISKYARMLLNDDATEGRP